MSGAMATSTVALSIFALACWTELASADAFLRAQPEKSSQYVAREDIEQLVLSGLSGFADAAHLRSAEEVLRPIFVALPKGEHGNLEPSSVRYALHRYFVQKHGWYVRGLDRTDRAHNSSSPGTTIMKDRAPSFIFGLFEERLRTEGLGLHELAVFAVTLSDLIHAEGAGKLERIFAGLQLPMEGPMRPEHFDWALKAYLVEYVSEDFVIDWKNASQVEAEEAELMELYPGYNDTYMWIQDFRKAHFLERSHNRNPFVEHHDTFSGTVEFVQELGHHFGSFQNLECRAMKNRLLKKDPSATGRVHLSDFYSFSGINGQLFTESAAYLRNIGALDEADRRKPTVMVANYLTSLANCISSSSFYSVCCINECNSLVGQLEREIEAPSAAPARIASIVSRLRSDTVDAPRNLSANLLARLEEIADFNDGQVPLHGRLFTQWMHHAYPRECPFPSVAGAERALTVEQWAATGRQLEATHEEMEIYRKRKDTARLTADSIPWAAEEELVVEPERWTSASLQTVMAFAALVSFAVPVFRAGASAASGLLAAAPEEKPAAFAPKARGKAGGAPSGKAVRRKPEERVV